MKTMMDRLQVEDDKLNLEREESHGDYEKMRLIFEKRIDLQLQLVTEKRETSAYYWIPVLFSLDVVFDPEVDVAFSASGVYMSS